MLQPVHRRILKTYILMSFRKAEMIYKTVISVLRVIFCVSPPDTICIFMDKKHFIPISVLQIS